MIDDYLEIRNAEGMPKLVDASLATAFLLNAKSAVRNYAIALTEATTPEVRTVLSVQLDNSINMYEEICDLMINKKWLEPTNLNRQFQMDLESSLAATEIANMNLFPGNTSRIGLFATVNK